MKRATQVFVVGILGLGVLVFGLPFTGLVSSTVLGGIQVGVAIAWAATIVIPALILAYNFGVTTEKGAV